MLSGDYYGKHVDFHYSVYPIDYTLGIAVSTYGFSLDLLLFGFYVRFHADERVGWEFSG